MPGAKRPASAFSSIVPPVREAVAAHVTLAAAMLHYCRAVAVLPPEVRAALAEVLSDLAEAEATGRELRELTPHQLTALATELRAATNHAEIRRAAHRLLRGERHAVAVLEAHAAAQLTPLPDGAEPAP